MAETPRRRRSNALADSDLDITPGGQTKRPVSRVDPNKIVMVEIERPFTLTLDDHRPVHYDAGIDEMPYGHATHWWAKAHGVKLYVGKRATPEQQAMADAQAAASSKPPEPDPDKLPKNDVDLKAMSALDVRGNVDLTAKM